jgi:hypothetical protein
VQNDGGAGASGAVTDQQAPPGMPAMFTQATPAPSGQQDAPPDAPGGFAGIVNFTLGQNGAQSSTYADNSGADHGAAQQAVAQNATPAALPADTDQLSVIANIPSDPNA